MTVAAPRVWHVAVRGIDSTDEIADRASARGWEPVRVRCVRLASGRGRILDVLERGDADRLYGDMHRRPVAVVYEGKPRVRSYPRPPFRDDRSVSLYQFCRYKSFAVSLRSDVAAHWESAFESWLGYVDCDGPSDPRVLPFHIFAARQALELDEMAKRQQFRRLHHQGGALVDKRERRWAISSS